VLLDDQAPPQLSRWLRLHLHLHLLDVVRLPSWDGTTLNVVWYQCHTTKKATGTEHSYWVWGTDIVAKIPKLYASAPYA